MQQADFLAGVVEGFYGRQWTHAQRLQLFARLQAWGLNTYFYAPKDDLKHRAVWRELYTAAELDSFRELARSCGQYGVRFLYGLSPGLDLRFSDPADVARIQARFEQLRGVGVRHFALLFDDLPGQLSAFDRQEFPSLAAAQCAVTNRVFHNLRRPDESPESSFLFCPTPYCDLMDRQQLGGAGYLDDLGRNLAPEIDVLWTGPEIVSRTIPVTSITELSKRIGRRPVVWDNLFANDYDMLRLHCGPYSGRSLELRGAVRGILINPNNEFPINYVPLRTFAAYLAERADWQPRAAYRQAVAEWFAQFTTARTALTLDDLLLLADCFYLPHENGEAAESLLALVQRLLGESSAAWASDYETFGNLNRRVQAAFECLTELRDRDLFQAWSRHGWQLKEELQMLDIVLAFRQRQGRFAEPDELRELLPGTFREGVLAKLAHWLPGCLGTTTRSRT